MRENADKTFHNEKSYGETEAIATNGKFTAGKES